MSKYRKKVTEYEVGQDNVQVMGMEMHNPVFFISALLITIFVIATLLFQEQASTLFKETKIWMTASFDWFFLLTANIFVIVCLVLVFTPYGNIRLGGQAAKPEFNMFSWFAMLFAAGMGIGLMFWSVAEPVFHFQSPPLGAEPGTMEAFSIAMGTTIFHWGLHAWAIYAVVGLALAFFCFNQKLPLTIRSAFHPLLGDAVWGWPGHIIDTLAIFATIFGLATSLGFGAEQASAGLHYLFGFPATEFGKVLLIIGITSMAVTSVVVGIEAGVKRLSEINMSLALILFVFVIIVGPTFDIIQGWLNNTIAYITNLPQLSFWFSRDKEFLHGWTVFYWAWWIAWSPFVGMFIARVSKGRTVRQFIIAVLLVPTLITILWMSAFGGTALHQMLNGVGDMGAVVNDNVALAMFALFEHFPLTQILSFIGIVLVIIFFVTSSDSGSLVIDSISAGGKLETPVAQRVFWASTEGLLAIALLLGGGLGALQTAAITTGLPFAVVLLLMCIAIFKGLHQELQLLKTVK